MADERYRGAFDAAVEEVNDLLAQLAEKKKFANILAAKVGIDAPYDDADAPIGVSAAIRADQFANHAAPSSAARAYLEWRGQEKGAASLEMIYDALVDGGFAFTSTKNDPKGGLRVALGKDSLVHRLPNGNYGLKEWYPLARRTGGKVRTTQNGDAANEADGDESDGDDSGEEELLDPKVAFELGEEVAEPEG